ncbi:hypothetical protein SKAU_G00334290 [Synaphobranchus kaupii]|uniref:Uncharacterized protein n=1 Tax=Synaphobranchus kaupii TaxID=118154 RepID=A0A9Q1ELS5_SYNKA|nr:hypothetical protein SKAU_G00334290 [Synaphobranchus kaupii]
MFRTRDISKLGGRLTVRSLASACFIVRSPPAPPSLSGSGALTVTVSQPEVKASRFCPPLTERHSHTLPGLWRRGSPHSSVTPPNFHTVPGTCPHQPGTPKDAPLAVTLEKRRWEERGGWGALSSEPGTSSGSASARHCDSSRCSYRDAVSGRHSPAIQPRPPRFTQVNWSRSKCDRYRAPSPGFSDERARTPACWPLLRPRVFAALQQVCVFHDQAPLGLSSPHRRNFTSSQIAHPSPPHPYPQP